MAMVPNVEAILLKINEAFGLNELQTSQKKRFVNQEKPLQDQIDLGAALIEDLRLSLDLPEGSQLFGDLLQAMHEFISWHSAVETNTRTYDADSRQIIWTILTYQIIPGWGRKYGFWSLDEPVAVGMAYGDLWFLPRETTDSQHSLKLPVQNVVDWWLDLLDQKLENIWTDELGLSRTRSLQNWKKGTLPEPDSMTEYFLPEHTFTYNGVFVDDAKETLDQKFERALEFVSNIKGITVEELSREIPNVQKNIFQNAFSGGASRAQKEAFINAVLVRWQEPTNEMVSRRLLIARALQHGYQQLVDLFTPGVSYECSDPMKNKALQLVELFKYVYEQTILAEDGCKSENEAYAKFHQLIPSEFAHGPLSSIMPNQRMNELQLSSFLSQYFRALKNGDVLEGLFNNGNLASGLMKIAPSGNSQNKDGIEELLEKLHPNFMSDDPNRQDVTEDILNQLASHPEKSSYEADILYMQGRHFLALNNTDEAKEKFEAAFNACKTKSYGSMRRRIAWACLGFQSAFTKFDKRSEKYIRILLAYVKPEETNGYHSYEDFVENFHRDKVREVHAWFWDYFYKPYPCVVPLKQVYVQPFKNIIKGLFTHHSENELKQWLKANKKSLESHLQDIDGNTFFTLLQKMISSFVQMLNHPQMPREQRNEAVNLISQLRGVTHFLAKNLSKKVLNCSDIKQQTALGLAVSHKDIELVKILVDRKVDLNKRSYQGKTALHEAAAIRSSECFMLLLNKGADPTLKTIDDLSPIHTAVKFGLVDVVEQFLSHQKYVLTAEDIMKMREIADEIYHNYKKIRPIFSQERREIAPKPAYKKLGSILASIH